MPEAKMKRVMVILRTNESSAFRRCLCSSEEGASALALVAALALLATLTLLVVLLLLAALTSALLTALLATLSALAALLAALAALLVLLILILVLAHLESPWVGMAKRAADRKRSASERCREFSFCRIFSLLPSGAAAAVAAEGPADR
jgi:hypothetical protein